MSDPKTFRLLCFLLVLGATIIAERFLPRRDYAFPRGPRWRANLSLMGLSALAVWILFPASLVEIAFRAENARFGLLNQVSWPYPVKLLLGLVALDLMIYFQHRLFHAVPALWRAHRVHHLDLDLDASAGVRFHPFEILLSQALKVFAIAFLGAHFLTVALFEVYLVSTSVFNHANLNLGPLDRVLRLVLVTPDMHRIHHSTRREEHDSNYGFGLPWWDRLFGTYRAAPAEPHETMPLGLPAQREPSSLYQLLAAPIRKPG